MALASAAEATKQQLAALVTKTPFTVGHKQIFLPGFAVSLLRSGHLGPKYARFQVPLWFSKLDLRDYLYHAYNVRILNVRSYVKLRPVQQGIPSGRSEQYFGAQYKRWHRPKSLKFMTVELESPFVWPEPPTDLSPWQQEMHLESERIQKQMGRLTGNLKDATVDREHLSKMQEQYKGLMDGSKQWETLNSKSFGPVLKR